MQIEGEILAPDPLMCLILPSCPPAFYSLYLSCITIVISFLYIVLLLRISLFCKFG